MPSTKFHFSLFKKHTERWKEKKLKEKVLMSKVKASEEIS